jgi:predicted nucleic acid-binding protein
VWCAWTIARTGWRWVIVVGASVLANVIGDDGTDGDRAHEALRGHELSVPDLVDVEVLSALRRRWLSKTMTARRLAAAVDDLGALPADRYPVLPFMSRAYELRVNVGAYDATYVALAEQLDCVLVTADRRLPSAPGAVDPHFASSRCSAVPGAGTTARSMARPPSDSGSHEGK